MNKSIVNTRIKKISAADQVCDKIKSYIKDELWKMGERLPSESDLASMFGVNRLTVRLALQKLNTMGIVETRTGSGTYVVEFDFSDYIQEVSEFYMEPELLDNVCEFRKLVEVECGQLAIERGTEDELEALHELLLDLIQKQEERLRSPSTDNMHNCAQADVTFHKQIVKMAHNKLYTYAFEVAQNSIYQYILILDKQRIERGTHIDASPNIFDFHTQIYHSIRNRDSQRCRELYLMMVDHKVEI